MVLAMVAKITFPTSRGREQILIRKPETVKITSSWRLLTDTAVVTLPRNVQFFDKNKVSEVFKSGDPIIIELGYNGIYHREFEGFVTRVSAGVPIRVECEDAMWKLKQIPVNISLQKTTLSHLLHKTVTGYQIDALEVNLGTLRYAKTTVAAMLDDLKNKYNLYSYIQDNQLIVGKIYADDSDLIPINIHLEKNVVDNSLKYQSKDDIFIKIKATSTQPNGKKIEAAVGDKQGEERQLTYYNITDKKELIKLANEDLKKYKQDGFSGNLNTFGIPVINHGNKIRLTSDQYPDRNGLYYVESVTKEFDASPKFRRAIQLGDKVSA